MTFGSLFAGIGGFDLGFERAGLQCAWQVEIDDYCRRVLAKHWPNVPRHDDVRTFPPAGEEDWSVDVICGGFPCQDLSLAGRRSGLDGERSGLWWEFARIICVLRPRYVVVENVPGLLAPTDRGRPAPIGCVLGELARLGYDAEWESIPASASGATQERYRVFVVAYPAGDRDRPRVLSERPRPAGQGTTGAQGSYPIHDAHHECAGREELHVPPVAAGQGLDHRILNADDSDADCVSVGQRATENGIESDQRGAPSKSGRPDSPFVGEGWWSAEPPLVRMVYGVPRRVVRPAIRGLGNAVVPQVAEWIGRQLIEYDR